MEPFIASQAWAQKQAEPHEARSPGWGPDCLSLPHTGMKKMLLKTGGQESTPRLSSRTHGHHADSPNTRPGGEQSGEADLASCSNTKEKPSGAKGL